MSSLKIKRSRRAQNSDKISNFTKSAFYKHRKLTIRDWLESNRLKVRNQMTEQKITQDHQQSSHPSIANHDQVAIYTHHTLMLNRSSLVIAPVIRLETPHLYCEPRVSTAIDPRNRFTPILVLTVQLHTVRSNSHSFHFVSDQNTLTIQTNTHYLTANYVVLEPHTPDLTTRRRIKSIPTSHLAYATKSANSSRSLSRSSNTTRLQIIPVQSRT